MQSYQNHDLIKQQLSQWPSIKSINTFSSDNYLLHFVCKIYVISILFDLIIVFMNNGSRGRVKINSIKQLFHKI